MEPFLRVCDISYAYHSPLGATPALSGISFTVNKGEFLAIVGPSGCGKSTLLSLLAGLLTPEEGSVYRLIRIAMLHIRLIRLCGVPVFRLRRTGGMVRSNLIIWRKQEQFEIFVCADRGVNGRTVMVGRTSYLW